MPKILVASDAAWVRDHVKGALASPGFEVIEATRGQDVRDLVGTADPDLVVVDMQIANMGGFAVSLDLRLEESAGRLEWIPVLLLLDREADAFLARRSQADASLVKPVDAGTLRRTVKNLLKMADERYDALDAAEAAFATEEA